MGGPIYTERREITLTTKHGPETVWADCYGDILAVHAVDIADEEPTDCAAHQITHIPTGTYVPFYGDGAMSYTSAHMRAQLLLDAVQGLRAWTPGQYPTVEDRRACEPILYADEARILDLYHKMVWRQATGVPV